MTWTTWINFLPLLGNKLSSPHEIWLQLAQWFQRRYLKIQTHTHTHSSHPRTQQLRVIPDETKNIGGGGGGAGFWRQSTIFLWGEGDGGEAVFCCCCCCFFVLFFSIQWQLALWKCIIFCRWWSFSKMQFVQIGSVGMKKKKLLFFEKGSPEQNELCECHGGGVDW